MNAKKALAAALGLFVVAGMISKARLIRGRAMSGGILARCRRSRGGQDEASRAQGGSPSAPSL